MLATNQTAADLVAVVERHLEASTPRGVPASHTSVTAVRVVSDDSKHRVLDADVTLFDGEQALLRVTEHRGFAGPMWSHRWFMDRPVFWRDGAWHRGEEGTRIWDTSPAAAA